MSQKDNFAGGFLLGAIVGGAVGGVVGALLASRQLSESDTEEPLLNSNQAEPKLGRSRKKALKSANGQSNIEMARRSLEDKIAQLNEAIDDVRQQLGGMHRGTSGEEGERQTAREP